MLNKFGILDIGIKWITMQKNFHTDSKTLAGKYLQWTHLLHSTCATQWLVKFHTCVWKKCHLVKLSILGYWLLLYLSRRLVNSVLLDVVRVWLLMLYDILIIYLNIKMILLLIFVFCFWLQCWWWISTCHLLFWEFSLLKGLSSWISISLCKYI